MKPIIKLLTFMGMLLCLSKANAQLTPTFTLEPQGASPHAIGSTLDVQFKVSNFELLTITLAVSYPQTILQFNSVTGFGVGGLNASSFANTIPGKVTMSWNTATGDPVTVPNGTSIVTFRFNVIGDGVANVNFAPNLSPTMEIIASGFAPVTPPLNNATTSCGTGTPPPPGYNGFTIIEEGASVLKNTQYCMPIKVWDFDTIQGMQFAMHWNPLVLKYDSLNQYGFPLNSTNGLTVFPISGSMGITYSDPTALGRSIPDLTTVFKVCFTAIGNVGTQDIPYFDGAGISGGIEVFGPSGLKQFHSSPDTIFVVAPVVPSGTIEFIAEKDSSAAGGSTCIDFTVKNFKNIVGAQFAISYDPALITFTDTNYFANPLSLGSGTNQLFAPAGVPGQLRFTFSATDPVNGLTLVDNTRIFQLCFNAIGAAGTTSAITMGAVTGFPMEITQGPGAPTFPTPVLTQGSYKITAGGVPLSITVDSTKNVSCFGGTNGAIYITPHNAASYTYAWSGPSSFTANTQDLTGRVAGTYTVTVTGAGGGTATATATITQPTAITLPTATPTPVNCFGSFDGAISISASGGTPGYMYNWTGPVPFSGSSAQNLVGLGAGNYKVTITDTKGCTFVSGNILVATPQPLAIPTSSISQNNVTCFGLSNGSITLNITGGTGPYNLTCTGGATPITLNNITANPVVISGLKAAGYTINITDSHNCTVATSSPINITEPQKLEVAIVSVTNATCFATNTGKIDINVTGGTTAYSYAWTAPAGGNDPQFLYPGSYNVTVTDANNCTATLLSPAVVSGPPSALTVTSTPDNVDCFNGNNGSICLTATGGYPGTPTSINWTGPFPLPSDDLCQYGLVAGTYSVTYTDAGGCSKVLTNTLTQPPTLTVSNTVISPVTCFGQGNGAIQLVPTGGNGGPYSATWQPGNLSGLTISNLQAGNYTPTLVDVSGCSMTLSPANVPGPSAPIAVNGSVTDPIGSALNGAIDLTVTGGTGSYTYLWSPSGAVTEDLTGIGAGNYTVTVTDAALCQTTATFTLSQIINFQFVSIQATAKNCPGSNPGTGTALVNVTGGSLPYTVTVNGVANGVVYTSDIFTVEGLSDGISTIVVIDNDGNTVSNTVDIGSHFPVVVNTFINSDFDHFCNGSVSMTPPIPGSSYQYYWGAPLNNLPPTQSSASGLCNGVYTVTVQDMLTGCTMVFSDTVKLILTPIDHQGLSSTNPQCGNSTNGSICSNDTGGKPPFTYSWAGPSGPLADTDNCLDQVPVGTYIVTVTDLNGTTVVDMVTLSSQSNLVLGATVNSSYGPAPGFPVSGANQCDGSVTLSATGGVGANTIVWSNGVTGATNTTLCAGAYSVTVTDAFTCSMVYSSNLAAPEAILPNGSAVTNYNGFNTSCSGKCDGIVRIYAAGGVPPYTLEWSGGQTATLLDATSYYDLFNLCADTYTVTITDATHNSSTQTVEVTGPGALSIDFTEVRPSSFRNCDGEIVANPVNAAGDVMFTWSGIGVNDNDSKVENLCAGAVLSILIRDENGCTFDTVTTVGYPDDGCYIASPVITPATQDGKNDIFLITCIESSLENTVEVFNRWGQIVFETSNYNNQTNNWTGNNKRGQPLPEGVYFYVINFVDEDGNDRQIKGYVSLIR